MGTASLAEETAAAGTQGGLHFSVAMAVGEPDIVGFERVPEFEQHCRLPQRPIRFLGCEQPLPPFGAQEAHGRRRRQSAVAPPHSAAARSQVRGLLADNAFKWTVAVELL